MAVGLGVEDADGDFRGIGVRFDLSAQGGATLGRPWIEFSVEAGRRNYLGDEDALVFDFGEASFSLAQNDYTYVELSAIAGGALPHTLEWELYAFLSDEAHDVAHDDVHLFSFSLAVKKHWPILR